MDPTRRRVVAVALHLPDADAGPITRWTLRLALLPALGTGYVVWVPPTTATKS
jgi:hypothetical protein